MPVSEGTADQLQASLLLNSANKPFMTLADVFAFKPTGTLWTVLNFFFVLPIPGATTRAVRIRAAAMRRLAAKR